MKKTKARVAILNELSKGGIYSAEKLQRNLEHYDLATIYRNLKLFVKTGQISEINAQKDKKLYEIKTDEHQHAICGDCGKINHFEVDKDELNKLIGPALDGFEVDDIEIIVKGKCN